MPLAEIATQEAILEERRRRRQQELADPASMGTVDFLERQLAAEEAERELRQPPTGEAKRALEESPPGPELAGQLGLIRLARWAEQEYGEEARRLGTTPAAVFVRRYYEGLRRARPTYELVRGAAGVAAQVVSRGLGTLERLRQRQAAIHAEEARRQPELRAISKEEAERLQPWKPRSAVRPVTPRRVAARVRQEPEVPAIYKAAAELKMTPQQLIELRERLAENTRTIFTETLGRDLTPADMVFLATAPIPTITYLLGELVGRRVEERITGKDTGIGALLGGLGGLGLKQIATHLAEGSVARAVGVGLRGRPWVGEPGELAVSARLEAMEKAARLRTAGPGLSGEEMAQARGLAQLHAEGKLNQVGRKGLEDLLQRADADQAALLRQQMSPPETAAPTPAIRPGAAAPEAVTPAAAQAARRQRVAKVIDGVATPADRQALAADIAQATPAEIRELKQTLGPAKLAEVAGDSTPVPRSAPPALADDEVKILRALRHARDRQGNHDPDVLATIAALEDLERLRIPPIQGGQNPVERVKAFLKEVLARRDEIEALKTANVRRQLGVARAIRESGLYSPTEAHRLSMVGMKGSAIKGIIKPDLWVGADELDYLVGQVHARGPKVGLNDAEIVRAGEVLRLKLQYGTPPAPSEIKLLTRVFGEEMGDLLNKLAKPRNATLLGEIADAFRLSGAIPSALDLSFLIRQAVLLAPSHPLVLASLARRYYVPLFFSPRPQELALRFHNQWVKDPRFDFATRAANLYYAPPEGLPVEPGLAAQRPTTVAGRVWQNYLGKTPLLGGSQLGFATMGNALRLSLFFKAMDLYMGAWSLADFQAYARWLNVATSRASMPGAVRDLLSVPFWSPSLQVSRVQAPGVLLHIMARHPHVRRQVARDLAAFLGFAFSLMAALKFSGAVDIELNPLHTDFARVRIGNVRVDLWGGYQPLVRTAARMVMRKRKTGGGSYFKVVPLEELARFGLAKLNPAAGALALLLGAPTVGGQPLQWDEELLRRLVPIFAQDLRDAFIQEGLGGGALAFIGFLGGTVLSYESAYDRLRSVQDRWLRENNLTREDLERNAAHRVRMYQDPIVAQARQQLFDWVRRAGGPPSVVAGAERERLRDQQRAALEALEAAVREGKLSVADYLAEAGRIAAETYNKSRGLDSLLEALGEKRTQEAAPGSVNAAVDAYFAIEADDYRDRVTGQVDWDAFFAAREKVLAALSASDRYDALTVINQYKPPFLQELEAERQQIEEAGWFDMLEQGARLAFPNRSLDELRAFARANLVSEGRLPTRENINRRLQEGIDRRLREKGLRTLSQARNARREADPELEALLLRHGYVECARNVETLRIVRERTEARIPGYGRVDGCRNSPAEGKHS